ncbi:MAG: flagellar basal body rod C-terminal domain-containing protein, partial [Hyphomicrobiales bacterium]
AEGVLVDNSNNPVLGDGGPITFTADEAGIEIAADGTISTTAGTKGRLRIVKFDSNAALQKESETLFSSGTPATPVDNPHVVQGMVERSNVNGTLEMTRMIETLRAYTNATQALEKTQELRRDAIERLGQTNV